MHDLQKNDDNMLEGSSHSRQFSSPGPATPQITPSSNDVLDDLFDGELEPEQEQLSVEVEDELKAKANAQQDAEFRELFRSPNGTFHNIPRCVYAYLADKADGESVPEEEKGSVHKTDCVDAHASNEEEQQPVATNMYFTQLSRRSFSLNEELTQQTEPGSSSTTSSHASSTSQARLVYSLDGKIHLLTDFDEDTRRKIPVRGGDPWDWHPNFKFLKPDAETPTEVELENIDFNTILEQITSKYTRRVLLEAEPNLTRKELFRAYRRAMKQDSSRFDTVRVDEDESGIAGDNMVLSPDESVVDLWPVHDPESLSNDVSDESRSRCALPERRCSSLMRSRPYLSDSSPIDIVSPQHKHFPQPPPRTLSRTSSLSAEASSTLDDLSKVTTSARNSFKVPSDSSSEDNKQNRYQSLSSSRNSTQPASPFLRPTTPASRGRSSPLRQPFEIEVSSVRATRGSPAPDPSDMPSRPDTPRPFGDDSTVPPEFRLGPSTMTDFLETPTRSQQQEIASVTSDSKLSGELSWGESAPSPNTGTTDLYALQSIEAEGQQERPRTPPLDRMEILPRSDAFASGEDEIKFASIERSVSPELEKLTVLAGQIYQAKRGEKGSKQRATSTHALARKKILASITSNGTTPRGRHTKSEHIKVQGRGVKVSKPRSRSRKASGRATRPAKATATDQIPDVPALPDDMDVDVDLPLEELQPSASLDNKSTERPAIGQEQLTSPETMKIDTPEQELKPKPLNVRGKKTRQHENSNHGEVAICDSKDSPPRSRAPRTPRSKKNATSTKRTPTSVNGIGNEDPVPLRRSPRIAKLKDKEKYT